MTTVGGHAELNAGLDAIPPLKPGEWWGAVHCHTYGTKDGFNYQQVYEAGELESRHSDLTPEVRPLVNSLAEKYLIDRYPGFDFEDPDWPGLRQHIRQVTALLLKV